MPAKHWSTDTHSVRERFGMGVVLLATVYVAVLFSVCRSLGSSWLEPSFLALLAAWVAACQVVARRWCRPRTVSLLAGFAYVAAWRLAYSTFVYGYTMASLGGLVEDFVGGAPAGYFAGTLVASVFLVHDAIRDTLRAKREEREALQAAIGETPRESPWDE